LNSILFFQVLDWLQNHGEVFLRKNVGIGRNLQKARAYQKSHETFEGVVQVGIKLNIFTRKKYAMVIDVLDWYKI
jgi:hypothetical protein